MSFYPMNPGLGQLLQTDVPGVTVDRAFPAHLVIPAASAVAASTGGVMTAAAPGTGAGLDVTTGLTNPAVPRNITATAGGTAGDIAAVQVTITGTDYAGNVISETLTAFTVDTAGTVTGAKCFKTVTRVQCPAMDGGGATVAIGWGVKFGLPNKLPANTVLLAALGGTREGTAPTVTVSSTALESNGFTLNSAPNGSQIDLYYLA